jgi:hypothetical protein
MRWITLYGNFRADGEALSFIGREMPVVGTSPPGLGSSETPAQLPTLWRCHLRSDLL